MKKKFAITFSVIISAVFVFLFVLPAFRGDVIVQADYFLGPIRIHVYSWTFFAAVVVGFFWVRKKAERFGLSVGQAENLVLINVIAGFIGARIHHIISAWDYYSQNLRLIPQVWHGGLGIYGGVIGGILATWVYCWVRKINFFTVADLLAPALVLGQVIGRWGNFFNQEAFGTPTELPWKMFVDLDHRFAPYLDFQFFHPTFLYESIWAIVVFLVLVRLMAVRGEKGVKGEMGVGTIFAWYLILYSLGRFFIEGLRADVTLFLGIPANQIIALVLAMIGVSILLFVSNKTLPNRT